MKKVEVVAAVIQNDENKILCALRSPHMAMPNVWEFPGGKVQKGEKLDEALTREIREELNCTIEVKHPITETFHQYPHLHVHLHTFQARIKEGKPSPLEHSQLRWVKKDELLNLKWADADIPTVHLLLKK